MIHTLFLFIFVFLNVVLMSKSNVAADYIDEMNEYKKVSRVNYVNFAKQLDVSTSVLTNHLHKKNKSSQKVIKAWSKKRILFLKETKSQRLISNYFILKEKNLITPEQLKKWRRTNKRNNPIRSLSSIIICYRNDGKGKGAFFDHVAIQKTTSRRTLAATLDQDAKNQVIEFARNLPYQLPTGVLDQTHSINIPMFVSDNFEGEGLLVIPGESKDANDENRKEIEATLLKRALMGGRPILALCGGCWHLWEHFGGKTRSVKDHAYNGGMLRLSNTSLQITHNVQIHDIIVKRNSLLESGLYSAHSNSGKEFIISVNSVHDKVIDPFSVPEDMQKHLVVSAISAINPDISKKTRHRNDEGEPKYMVPEENSPEAFELVYGAPVLGTQWHPEGYDMSCDMQFQPHINLITYMAKSGDTFACKKACLTEFKEFLAFLTPKML